MWKKSAALFMALCLCIGSIQIAEASEPAEQQELQEALTRSVQEELTLDTVTNVRIQETGDSVLFTFVPAETGEYYIYSENASEECDPAVALKTFDGTYYYTLASNDDGELDSKEFFLKHKLTAGTTYYFECKTYGGQSTGSYRVCLKKSIKTEENLTLNSVNRIVVDKKNSSQAYNFTPQQDGFYAFYSLGDHNFLADVELYSVDGNGTRSYIKGASQTDFNNFSIIEELKKGETYTYVFDGADLNIDAVLRFVDTGIQEQEEVTYTAQSEKDYDWYQVHVSKSGFYKFQTSGDQDLLSDSTFRLYMDDGYEMESAYTENGDALYRLNAGRTYLMQTGTESHESGSYQVQLVQADNYVLLYDYDAYLEATEAGTTLEEFIDSAEPQNCYFSSGELTYQDICDDVNSRLEGSQHLIGLYDSSLGKVDYTAEVGSGRFPVFARILEGDILVSDITITGPDEAYVGHPVQLTAELATEFGLDPTTDGVEWSSSDATIAQINEDGEVTGQRAGEVTITCRSKDGNAQKTKVMKVSAVKVKEVQISGAKSVMQGMSTSLTARLITDSGLEPTVKGVIWSSADEKIADIDENGKVTGIALGSTTIYCRPRDGGPQAAAAIEVTEYEIQIKTIRITGDSAVYKGNTLQLQADIKMTEGDAPANPAIKWSVLNDAIASVDRNGLVTGKMKGTTTVVCEATDGSGARDTMLLTVNELQSPVLVQAAATADFKINIRWKSVPDASGYKIYRKSGTEAYRELTSVAGGTVMEFKDASSQRGVAYTYTVAAYRTENGKTLVSAYNEKGISCTVPTDQSGGGGNQGGGNGSGDKPVIKTLSKPSIAKVSSAAHNKLKITWKKVENATGYILYRSTKKNSGYAELKRISGGSTTAYTDGAKIKTGTAYYYKIAAYRIDGTTIYSELSGMKSGKAIPATVKIGTAKNKKAGSVLVTWKKVAGASGYEVYYSTKKKGGFHKAKPVKKVKLTITGLKKKTYYIKVRAFKRVGKKNIYGSYSKVKPVKVRK